jgi:diacylglycerol O-acyltransferase
MVGKRVGAPRLTGLDTAFLALENDYSQMHTLKFGVFEAVKGPADLTAEAIWTVLGRRLHAVPCYTQKLMPVPFGLHHPLLVNATDFNVEDHVRVVKVPAPGGRRERDAVISDICGGTLDRRHPLWELWILEGLEGGRVGCLMKLHHTLADGRVAGNQLLAFANAANADLALVDNAPSGRRLVFDALVDRVRDAAKLPALIRDTARALRATREIRSQTMVKVPGVASSPHTLFDRKVSQERTWGTLSVPLSQMGRVAKHYRVSINDVLLTMVGSAAREYLLMRGDLPTKSLAGGLPVDSSSPADAGALQGNKWAMLMTTLGTDQPDVVVQLRTVSDSMMVAKRIRAACGDLLERWAQFTNLPAVQNAVTRFADSWLADKGLLPSLGISNVRGPESAAVVGDLRVAEFYSVGPINHCGLNVTAWSYAGQFNVSMLSGQNVVPDASVFLDFMRDALQELSERAGIDWYTTGSVEQRITS